MWDADYEPFGKANVLTSTFTNNFRFPGQFLDGATGLHYNYHRYYDPTIGRYLTADPIGLAGGVNLYSYAKSSPVNFIDPYGLWGVQFGDTNFGIGDPTFLFGEGSEDYFNQTLSATVDGFIPFVNPFKDSYNPCDKNLHLSKDLGGLSRDFALGAFGGSVLSKFAGSFQQWFRLGRSYSISNGFDTWGLRWGASPKYLNKIPDAFFRAVNQSIRQMKVPLKNWRFDDPGHFHFWKIK